MTATETKNIEVVRKYFDGCNSDDLAAISQRCDEARREARRRARLALCPTLEYRLTTWGESWCPALDALLKWAEMRNHHTPDADDCLKAEWTRRR
jgi:hypothetical protein